MTATGPRLGIHLPLAHGLVRAVERAAAIGADGVQVFADNPTAWRRRAEPSRELDAFRTRAAALGVEPVAIHAAYLVNLAGPDPVFHERSTALLASDLEAGAGYGARFVNAHVGSHLGAGVERGTELVVQAVAEALAATSSLGERPMVVLENSAGGGNGLGSTIDELAAILEGLREAGVSDDAVGLCLDTAHLWGAGYALDEPGGVDDLFAAFDGTIGLGRLAMVHLNDSKAMRGSRADRHEHLGGGRIGSEALGRVLRHPALDGVAVYLETPGMEDGYDAVNLARARDLLAGRSLAPLPPEAFALPPRRGRSRRAAADAA